MNSLTEHDNKIYPLFGLTILRRVKQRLGQIIIPLLPISRHLFDHFRCETNAIWVRINNKINPFYIVRREKYVGGDDLLINVACGPFGQKDWVNLDLMNLRNISFRWDCRKGIPLRQGSVKCIRCEHFLEHLDFYNEAPLFLKSCLRCLKKNRGIENSCARCRSLFIGISIRKKG